MIGRYTGIRSSSRSPAHLRSRERVGRRLAHPAPAHAGGPDRDEHADCTRDGDSVEREREADGERGAAEDRVWGRQEVRTRRRYPQRSGEGGEVVVGCRREEGDCGGAGSRGVGEHTFAEVAAHTCARASKHTDGPGSESARNDDGSCICRGQWGTLAAQGRESKNGDACGSDGRADKDTRDLSQASELERGSLTSAQHVGQLEVRLTVAARADPAQTGAQRK